MRARGRTSFTPFGAGYPNSLDIEGCLADLAVGELVGREEEVCQLGVPRTHFCVYAWAKDNGWFHEQNVWKERCGPGWTSESDGRYWSVWGSDEWLRAARLNCSWR